MNFLQKNPRAFYAALLALGVIVIIVASFPLFSYIKERQFVAKYKNDNDFKVAYASIQQSKELIKKNPKHDSAYYALGQSYYALGAFNEAIEALEKATEIAPQADYYWSFLGKAYQSKKIYPKAAEAYAKAIELQPDKTNNYVSLGWLYFFRLEAVEKAYEILKNGLEKFPNNPELLYDLTRYYMYMQNKEEFLKYAPQYLKINPNEEAIKEKYNEWK